MVWLFIWLPADIFRLGRHLDRVEKRSALYMRCDRMVLVRSVLLHFVYWYVYGFARTVSERLVKILNLRQRLRFRTGCLCAVTVHGFVG